MDVEIRNCQEKKKTLETFIYFADVTGDCRGQRIALSKFEVSDWGLEAY